MLYNASVFRLRHLDERQIVTEEVSIVPGTSVSRYGYLRTSVPSALIYAYQVVSDVEWVMHGACT